MGLKDHSADMLKKHSRDSLLIALWIGLPFGWIGNAIVREAVLLFGTADLGGPAPGARRARCARIQELEVAMCGTA